MESHSYTDDEAHCAEVTYIVLGKHIPW